MDAERVERDVRDREQDSCRLLAEERLRIARELHDTLGHALVAINVRAGVAAHLGARQDPYAALLDIEQTSHDALNDLRDTLRLLRERGESAPTLPAPASDLCGLPALVDRVRAGGLDVRLEMQLAGPVVPATVGRAGFRIVQEGLTNVLRHAHATRVEVSARAGGGFLELEVTDDGQVTGGVSAAGHGLRGMSERAAALGGQVNAGPGPGGGWQVHARLPLSGHGDGSDG